MQDCIFLPAFFCLKLEKEYMEWKKPCYIFDFCKDMLQTADIYSKKIHGKRSFSCPATKKGVK
jgi:hypothetical protein